MANHGWAYLKRKTKPEEITGLLGKGNRLRFGNNLELLYFPTDNHKQGCSWEIVFNREDCNAIINCQFFLDARMRKFEWRHIPDYMFGWWAQQWLAEYVVYQIDGAKGLIHDEGVEETWSPDYFIKFPTVTAWADEFFSHVPDKTAKGLKIDVLSAVKAQIGEDFFKVVSQEKNVLDTPPKG